jgi:hypothetical protein
MKYLFRLNFETVPQLLTGTVDAGTEMQARVELWDYVAQQGRTEDLAETGGWLELEAQE